MNDANKPREATVDAAETRGRFHELKAYLATPAGKAEVKASLQELIAEQSGKNGYCSDDNCKGLIVKRVHGLCSIGYIYSIPYCSKCGRQYIFAGENIPKVGHKEFEELMNKPFTI